MSVTTWVTEPFWNWTRLTTVHISSILDQVIIEQLISEDLVENWNNLFGISIVHSLWFIGYVIRNGVQLISTLSVYIFLYLKRLQTRVSFDDVFDRRILRLQIYRKFFSKSCYYFLFIFFNRFFNSCVHYFSIRDASIFVTRV